MAFDAEGFRNAAKGKFTDAEIEEVISRETASKPTAVSPSNTTTNEAAQSVPEITPRSLATPEGQKLIDQVDQQMAATPEPNAVAAGRELLPVAAKTLKQNAVEGFNSLTPTEANVIGGLGAAGLEYAIYRTLRDKPPPPPPPPAGTFTPPPPPPPGGSTPVKALRAEPTFDLLAPADMTMSAGEPILGEKVNSPPMYADEQQRVQRQQYQEKLDAIEKARSDARQGIVTQAPQPIAEVPSQVTNPAVEQLKARVNAIPTPEGTNVEPVPPKVEISPVAVVKPTETTPGVAALTQSLNPEGAAPPPAKKPRNVTPKGVPEGMTELVGGGPGDRWLANEHPTLRKAIITQFNDGKPAGSYEKAQDLYKQFKAYQAENIAGPVIPKEVAKERGMPPPKNYGAWGTKILKGAGVTGLALTAAEMAQAAEEARKGNYGPARETGFNLLGMIPGLGTAFNALTFSKGAGESPEELQRLQYMQQVGSGRGIAPPSR